MISFPDGSAAVARAVVIATGVTYRQLGIPALDRLLGMGLFYGAPVAEARAMAGERVVVVDAGNSAGQAALHLARFAAGVTILVRGDSLAAGMSEYLIQELAANARVEVRLGTRTVDARGDGRLEAVVTEDVRSGRRDELPAAAGGGDRLGPRLPGGAGRASRGGPGPLISAPARRLGAASRSAPPARAASRGARRTRRRGPARDRRAGRTR